MRFVFRPLYFLLLIVFCVYVFVAWLPQNALVWDEAYYRGAAINTIHGVADNVEHPPLVKLMLGVSILAIGNNWVAWRLPIIMFSLMSLALTYLIARRFLSERLSLFAVGLVSLSTIFMLVGSCGILDMPCLAFGLAGTYLALKGRYGWAGLLFGLSFLCKELALLMFLPVLIYLAVKRVGKFRLLWFGGVAFCVGFFGVWMYDLVYGSTSAVDISNPVIHWWLMVLYQLKLNGVTRAVSEYPWYPPWAWVSPFGNNALVPLRWVWLQVGEKMVYAWKSQPNVAVEYLMFPLLALLPIFYWVKRNSAALLSLLWICFTFLPWLIAGLVVRTEANFYVVYSIPFIAVGCAYLYSLIGNRKLRYGLAITQLIVGIGCFLWFFPIPIF